MKKFLNNYLLWIICVLSFIGFAIILIKYHNNALFNFDMSIYTKVTNIRNDNLTNILKIITYLGEYKLLILATILLFIFSKKKMFSIYLGLVSIGSFGINFFIKHIVQRPRPNWNFIISEDGYSFLSNHSIAMLTFYGFILYYLWKSNINKVYKVLSTIFILLIMIVVPFSRIYLGVHYPSDVLAGLLFGLSFLIAFIQIVYKKKIK